MQHGEAEEIEEITSTLLEIMSLLDPVHIGNLWLNWISATTEFNHTEKSERFQEKF